MSNPPNAYSGIGHADNTDHGFEQHRRFSTGYQGHHHPFYHANIPRTAGHLPPIRTSDNQYQQLHHGPPSASNFPKPFDAPQHTTTLQHGSQLTKPHTDPPRDSRGTHRNHPDTLIGSVFAADPPFQSIKPSLSPHPAAVKPVPSQSGVMRPWLSEDATTVDTGEDKKASKGRNFSKEEDVQLCKSRLAISEDPVTGTNQKALNFWESVLHDYSRYQTNSDRTIRSLQSRWGVINKGVSKFVGFLEKVSNVRGGNKSRDRGKNKEDRMADARAMYLNVLNKDFPFTAAYEVLCKAPKWHSGKDDNPVQVTPTSLSATGTSSLKKKREDTSDSDSSRPIGNKAAKRLRAATSTPSSSRDIATAQIAATTSAMLDQTRIIAASITQYTNRSLLLTDTSSLPPDRKAYLDREAARILGQQPE